MDFFFFFLDVIPTTRAFVALFQRCIEALKQRNVRCLRVVGFDWSIASKQIGHLSSISVECSRTVVCKLGGGMVQLFTCNFVKSTL